MDESDDAVVGDVNDERANLLLEIHRLRAALAEISAGRGRFSMDQLEHATNTIEDMKAIAVAALEKS